MFISLTDNKISGKTERITMKLDGQLPLRKCPPRNGFDQCDRVRDPDP